jgi:hypothetical protein
MPVGDGCFLTDHQLPGSGEVLLLVTGIDISPQVAMDGNEDDWQKQIWNDDLGSYCGLGRFSLSSKNIHNVARYPGYVLSGGSNE